ncbi:MAG: DUF3006 domain-containing protein [bacterium]
MKNDKTIQITELSLDRLEGDQAVLLNADDEETVLDRKMLPNEAREGDVLVMTIATMAAEKKRREQKAKDLLNEILNPETK